MAWKKNTPGCNSSPDCGCNSVICVGCPPFVATDDGYTGSGSPPPKFYLELFDFQFPLLNLNGCFPVTFQGSLTSNVSYDTGSGTVASGQTCCWYSNAPAPADWTSVPDTPDDWPAGILGFSQVPRVDVFVGTNDALQRPGAPVYVSVVVWDKANSYMAIFGAWSAFPLVNYSDIDDADATGASSFPQGIGFDPHLPGVLSLFASPFIFINGVDEPPETSVSTITLPAFDAVEQSCILVSVQADSGRTVSSISDTAGNTYSQIKTFAGNSGAIEIWGTFGAPASVANEVTVNLDASSGVLQASSVQFQGVATTDAVLGSAAAKSTGTATSITSPSFGSVLTDETSAFGMAAAFGFNKNAARTYTADARFTSRISADFTATETRTPLYLSPGTYIDDATLTVDSADLLDIVVVVLESNETSTFKSCNLGTAELPIVAADSTLCDSSVWSAGCPTKPNPCADFYSPWLLGFLTTCSAFSTLKPPSQVFVLGRCRINQLKCFGECCEAGTQPIDVRAQAVTTDVGAPSWITFDNALPAWYEAATNVGPGVEVFDPDYRLYNNVSPGGFGSSSYGSRNQQIPSPVGSYCFYYCGSSYPIKYGSIHVISGFACTVDDPSTPDDPCSLFPGPCESGGPTACGTYLIGKTVIIGRNGNPPSGPTYIYARITLGAQAIEYGTPFYGPSVNTSSFRNEDGRFRGGFKPDASPDTVAYVDDCGDLTSVTLNAFKYFRYEGVYGVVKDLTIPDGTTLTVSADSSAAAACNSTEVLVDLTDSCTNITRTVIVNNALYGFWEMDDKRCYTVAAATSATPAGIPTGGTCDPDTWPATPGYQCVDGAILKNEVRSYLRQFDDLSNCSSVVFCCCTMPLKAVHVTFPSLTLTSPCGQTLTFLKTTIRMVPNSSPCSADPNHTDNIFPLSELDIHPPSVADNCWSQTVPFNGGFYIDPSTCKIYIFSQWRLNDGTIALKFQWVDDMPGDCSSLTSDSRGTATYDGGPGTIVGTDFNGDPIFNDDHTANTDSEIGTIEYWLETEECSE